jgi:hypothetical protein
MGKYSPSASSGQAGRLQLTAGSKNLDDKDTNSTVGAAFQPRYHCFYYLYGFYGFYDSPFTAYH